MQTFVDDLIDLRFSHEKALCLVKEAFDPKKVIELVSEVFNPQALLQGVQIMEFTDSSIRLPIQDDNESGEVPPRAIQGKIRI